jgi:hypothetical protein
MPNASALPAEWIERIFALMLASYGTKFTDLWRGTDLVAVKAMWAEKLGGFADKPKAIKDALNALDERPFPPTLPEFLNLCREAAKRYGPTQQALPYRPTEADKQRLKNAATEAAKAVSMTDYDPLTWARKPKSQKALDMVLDGAKRNMALAQIVVEHVANGTCNEAGKLLKRYKGQGQWVKA